MASMSIVNWDLIFLHFNVSLYVFETARDTPIMRYLVTH